MKKFSKFLGVMLIMALVMSLGISTAFADETAVTGTLTVKNSEDGVTYNFYKIFDLTGQDTSVPADSLYDAVVYTIDSDWSAFFTGVGAEYIVAENNAAGTLNPIKIDGVTKYINITDDNAVEFTNVAMAYAIDNSLTVDKTATGSATGADVTVSGLDLGYYLMIPVDMTDEKQNPVSTGSVASLTSTIPTGDIYVKATKPSVEKTDNVISADIGQTVNYELKGTVPNTSGTASFIYKLSDKMSSGLTFKKDVKVEVVTDKTTNPVTTQTITTNCTIDYTTNANGFIVTIPVTSLQDYKGNDIILTYSAVVNENAIESTNEKNEAKVIYGRDPDHLEESIPVEEELYSANIIINKYTGSGESSTKLADAKFALMKIDNSSAYYYKYTAAVADNPDTEDVDESAPAKVEWVAVPDAPTSGTANVTDAQAGVLAAAGEARTITTKTTNDQGAASFDGLADGTYYLIEFAAPTGYNRLDTPKEVVVSGTNVDTTEMENVAQAGQETFDTAINATADVENNTGTVLPSTGGIGTTIFYVVGGILVVAAGVLLITKKRMSE